MARKFPRFLFSNPKNTKSKGPFIVHTIYPRFVAQVQLHNGEFEVQYDWWDTDFGGALESETEHDMLMWLEAQIRTGVIVL